MPCKVAPPRQTEAGSVGTITHSIDICAAGVLQDDPVAAVCQAVADAPRTQGYAYAHQVT